ncbi:hypothetical protein [Variovorax sp. OV329]|uniref:hypothetical protein n=1 Tax=Variovorax sp. OV329 TaxID=1882825 RepID=UPI0008E7A8D7|nr:hypothetical protein [Variovorax sp. OV329]SFN03325.1 hypothetical protein SAMN05444747_113107 [Variovorax sp. OV329]
MLRVAILLLTVLFSIGLAYTWGAWVLALPFAATLAMALFSTRTLEEAAAHAQPGARSSSNTTIAATLR